ncbi:MAG: hypothetical protein HFJ24_02890 [Clostridia bacterium]|nr:hypothetical protein [Clostridia bacterium]MCI9274976.1 hypothetical protein [Clostridia bacterium]
MVIVTFWNDNTGKIGQTHSAMAIASYMGTEHNYKTLLMTTRYDDQIALKAFGYEGTAKTVGLVTGNKQSMDLESGLEGMEKLVLAKRLSPDMVPNYTKIIYKNRLEVVTAPKKRDDLDFNRLYNSCKDILMIARQHYDIVFVDLNNGLENETTKEILKMSNIIILNMEQKPSEMQKIYELKQNKELFDAKKIMYLINNYDRKSKYSSKNISREMGEKKEIMTVPYANLFAEAVQEGTAAEFFLNTRIKRLDDVEDRTAFFIRELKRDTDAIVYKMQELQMRI